MELPKQNTYYYVRAIMGSGNILPSSGSSDMSISGKSFHFFCVNSFFFLMPVFPLFISNFLSSVFGSVDLSVFPSRFGDRLVYGGRLESIHFFSFQCLGFALIWMRLSVNLDGIKG